jgi:LysR family transcriptional regulator, benzoate and cis,cis-muconate-responsive activator of ben and cat genes
MHARVLERVDNMQSMTRRIAKGGLSRFNIGFSASTLYENLPELIRLFRVTTPDVDISVFEMTTIEQIAALKDGRIDVSFGRLRVEEPLLVREVLREEPLGVVLPRGPMRRVKNLTLLEIANEPLIIYPRTPRPSYADRVLSLYRDRGVEPAVACEVRELQTALGLVAAGIGICIVPTSACRVVHQDLRFIEFSEPDVVSPLIMSYRSSDRSPWIDHLRLLIRKFDTWKSNSIPKEITQPASKRRQKPEP